MIRTPEMILEFYYSSPGTGTRVAKLNLMPFARVRAFSLSYAWSPERITVGLRSLENAMQRPAFAYGTKSEVVIRVGRNKEMNFFGPTPRMIIKKVQVWLEEELMFDYSAIEGWEETLYALKVLNAGIPPASDDECSILDYTVVTCNLSISTLVTGL